MLLSGVTSGCCRRCSDLGHHRCRSRSRLDPARVSTLRMYRSMLSKNYRVQDRRLRPGSRLRTRDPRRRSVKEPICVSCSPPFGKTRAALLLGGAEPLGPGYPSEASDGRLTKRLHSIAGRSGPPDAALSTGSGSPFVLAVDQGHVRPSRQRQRPSRRHRLRPVAARSTENLHRGMSANRRRRRRAFAARRLAAAAQEAGPSALGRLIPTACPQSSVGRRRYVLDNQIAIWRCGDNLHA